MSSNPGQGDARSSGGIEQDQYTPHRPLSTHQLTTRRIATLRATHTVRTKSSSRPRLAPGVEMTSTASSIVKTAISTSIVSVSQPSSIDLASFATTITTALPLATSVSHSSNSQTLLHTLGWILLAIVVIAVLCLLTGLLLLRRRSKRLRLQAAHDDAEQRILAPGQHAIPLPSPAPTINVNGEMRERTFVIRNRAGQYIPSPVRTDRQPVHAQVDSPRHDNSRSRPQELTMTVPRNNHTWSQSQPQPLRAGCPSPTSQYSRLTSVSLGSTRTMSTHFSAHLGQSSTITDAAAIIADGDAPEHRPALPPRPPTMAHICSHLHAPISERYGTTCSQHQNGLTREIFQNGLGISIDPGNFSPTTTLTSPLSDSSTIESDNLIKHTKPRHHSANSYTALIPLSPYSTSSSSHCTITSPAPSTPPAQFTGLQDLQSRTRCGQAVNVTAAPSTPCDMDSLQPTADMSPCAPSTRMIDFQPPDCHCHYHLSSPHIQSLRLSTSRTSHKQATPKDVGRDFVHHTVPAQQNHSELYSDKQNNGNHDNSHHQTKNASSNENDNNTDVQIILRPVIYMPH